MAVTAVMPCCTGVVQSIDENKGYGFIIPDVGPDGKEAPSPRDDDPWWQDGSGDPWGGKQKKKSGNLIVHAKQLINIKSMTSGDKVS